MVAGYGATRSTDMAVVWDGPSGDQVVPNAPEVWHARGADVNALSQVVGSAAGLEWTQAFLWDPLTGMQLLGALSGSDPTDSHAAAVNDFGQVVGHSTIGFVDRAFLWTEAGGMTDLNALIDGGGVLHAALDISDAGHIVGWGVAEGTDWLQAFLLTPEELNPVAPLSAVEDSVPLPAGAALLPVALAGLALFRRRAG